MLKIIILIITVSSLCLLGILLITTTPATAGPFGLLAVFILAYLSLIGVVALLLTGFSRIIAYLATVMISRKPFEVLTLKRAYYYSTIIAAAPIMLIGLQSVGSVGLYEYLLMVIFIVIGCLYISKRIN